MSTLFLHYHSLLTFFYYRILSLNSWYHYTIAKTTFQKTKKKQKTTNNKQKTKNKKTIASFIVRLLTIKSPAHVFPSRASGQHPHRANPGPSQMSDDNPIRSYARKLEKRKRNRNQKTHLLSIVFPFSPLSNPLLKFLNLYINKSNPHPSLYSLSTISRSILKFSRSPKP